MSADPAQAGAGVRRAVLALLLAALVVGCDVGGGDHEPRRSAGSAESLRWHACEAAYRCARLTVPLDWEHPGGRTVSLAVMKVPALHPHGKAHSLVVNPGGPGGSGIDFASYAANAFGSEVLGRYDVVGFDPRGVMRSAPVRCLPQAGMNDYLAATQYPVGAVAQRRWTVRTRHFGRACLRRTGPLARHVATTDTVRDLDASAPRPSASPGSPTWGSPTAPTWVRRTPQGIPGTSVAWCSTERSTRACRRRRSPSPRPGPPSAGSRRSCGRAWTAGCARWGPRCRGPRPGSAGSSTGWATSRSGSTPGRSRRARCCSRPPTV